MKKITILALHLGYGGIEKYIATLCDMLADKFEIEIISTYTNEKIAFKLPSNVKVTCLINDISNRKEFHENVKNKKFISASKEAFRGLKLLYLKKELNKKAIMNLKTDYVITTRTFHNELVNKYCPKGIIKIASDHNYHDNDQEYISYLKKTVSNFDFFVCISKKLYNDYKDIFKPKCVYIPNVVSKSKTRSKLTSNDIISVGRFESVKGFDDLLKVAKILRNKNDNFKWHIIGDGPEFKSINESLKLYQLEKNIVLHGFLSQDNIAQLYDKSLLYVMTSHSESFGIVLLEAMSHGLPCLSFSSASGAVELIEDKKMLIENRNMNEMADRIDEFLKNKDSLKEIGDSNLEKCSKYYIDNVKEEWIKLLGD